MGEILQRPTPAKAEVHWNRSEGRSEAAYSKGHSTYTTIGTAGGDIMIRDVYTGWTIYKASSPNWRTYIPMALIGKMNL